MQQNHMKEDHSVEDDHLAERRARGRRAQREFRQRQIDTINELQASKESLQAAIASIAGAAAQQDSAGMTKALRDACKVAGIEIPQESGSSLIDPSSSSVHDEPPAQESSHVAGATTASWEQEPNPQSQSRQNFQISPYTSGSAVENPRHQSGRMSPTLGYGLWRGPEASISIEYPPMDIVPYLQGGSSFGITLFWTSLSWGFQILGAALAGNSEAVATAQNIFGPIISTSPGRYVLNGMHARLTYRKTGTIDRDHPGNNPGRSPRIKAAITRLCEDNGTPLETFLTPLGMENFLRNRLGPAYDVIDRTVRGDGSPEDMSRLRGLIQMMTTTSVCLGDGPRWSIVKAENVFTYWAYTSGLHIC